MQLKILLDQANRVTTSVVGRETCGSANCWKKPPWGWFKISWDFGLNRATARVGMGMVVRDSHGKFVAARIVSRCGCLDSTSGEALASYHAAILCKDNGGRCFGFSERP